MYQATIVQTVEGIIHLKNHALSPWRGNGIQWRLIHPLDDTRHPLNNQYKSMHEIESTNAGLMHAMIKKKKRQLRCYKASLGRQRIH